jgi:hypothetical protein
VELGCKGKRWRTVGRVFAKITFCKVDVILIALLFAFYAKRFSPYDADLG